MYRLYGAPRIIRGESISSWLQRLSQQQGMAIETLLSIVDAKTPSDLDSGDIALGLSKLVGACRLSHDDFEPVMTANHAIRNNRFFREQIRKNDKGRPISAYCPDCLSRDHVPHLRIEWRFRFWEYCPEHRIPLLKACQKCQGEVRVDKAILLSAAAVPTLAYCRLCSTKLVHGYDINCNVDLEERTSIQRAVAASIMEPRRHGRTVQNRVTPELMLRLRELGLVGAPVQNGNKNVQEKKTRKIFKVRIFYACDEER